jgi:hypothetical protein
MKVKKLELSWICVLTSVNGLHSKSEIINLIIDNVTYFLQPTKSVAGASSCQFVEYIQSLLMIRLYGFWHKSKVTMGAIHHQTCELVS